MSAQARLFDVVVTGGYYMDLVFTGLESLPQLGREILSKDFNLLPGGSFTTSVTLKRLGIKTAWAADFGTDLFSRLTRQQAEEEGVDLGLSVQHDRSMANITVSCSFPEDRAFITYCDPEPALLAALRNLTQFDACVIYIPGFYTGKGLGLIHSLPNLRGTRLVMDGNTNEIVTLDKPANRRILKTVDLFLCNRREAEQLTGENDLQAMIAALQRYCAHGVVKIGKDGAWGWRDGELVYVPGIPVRAIDTTGAGDVFNAGYLAAWLEGLPLERCLRWGNLAGGLSTQKLGGVAFRMDRAILLEAENKYYPSGRGV